MQKSACLTEEDLHKAGYTVVGNEAVLLGDVRPDPTWNEDRLAVYAKGELASSKEADHQAILQARKSAIHLFRAGHALALARDKCKGEKHGAWKEFKERHGLADTTANDAIRLYERAKTEDALAGLGITEAKEKFGIARHKKHPARSRQSGTSAGTGTTEADADKDQNDKGKPSEKSGEKIEEPASEETGESSLNHKKVIIRLVSDEDKDAVRTAVADYSPVVKSATGVRLVAFVVSPKQLGKALQALFKSLVKIESFNLEVQ